MDKVKKLYKKETFKNREDWLNHRGIGGSSASTILDMNPWASKLDLYFAIKQPSKYISDKEDDSEVLAYGRAMEPLIRKEFALDNSKKYKVLAPINNAMYRSTIRPWQTATIDSQLVEIETGRKGIHEIKTHDIRRSQDAEEWETGTIPQQYFIQVLHYLAVLNDFDFVVLTARLRYWKFINNDYVVEKVVTLNYYIERKDVQKEIDYLVKKEDRFMENTLKGLVPAITLKLPVF